MQRSPLKSRALLSAGYDADGRVLELEFSSGHVYRYEDVPESVYAWLLRAPNKGVFVARHISGRYSERAVPAQGAVEQADVSLELSLSASLAALAERRS